MTIRKRTTWVAIAAITLAGTGIFPLALRADTITMTGLSPGPASVANRVAAPFSYFAGSPENAVALANALRTGTTATVSYTSADPNSQTTTTTTDITVPTRPMGWGNVSHALALASYSLRQAGIEQPTAAELQAALNGGAVTNANGQATTLAGVLQQRASGMGWGQIAQSYGTTMGAVNHSIRVPSTVTAPTSTSVATTSPSGGSTSLSTRGVTSASGATTATGATSTGVVTANGTAQAQAHAYGRGIVTANGGAAASTAATTTRGSSAGVVTGNGAAATMSNAGSGASASHAGGNGNGKGKGGG
jgi:hypothetical protein